MISQPNIHIDPIHGKIELPDYVQKIINTEEFQRLRNLRQLGLSHWIFPGAIHTRYEHCIGYVCKHSYYIILYVYIIRFSCLARIVFCCFLSRLIIYTRTWVSFYCSSYQQKLTLGPRARCHSNGPFWMFVLTFHNQMWNTTPKGCMQRMHLH